MRRVLRTLHQRIRALARLPRLTEAEVTEIARLKLPCC